MAIVAKARSPIGMRLPRSKSAWAAARRCSHGAAVLLWLGAAHSGLAQQAPVGDCGGQAPHADTRWPQLLAAQYTGVLQHQRALRSPYTGALSLEPDGDTQPSHTFGFYSGWAVTDWAQFYLDTEKFIGAGVSRATGLAGLTNGDVVREGAEGLPKRFYIARRYVRLLLPRGAHVTSVARAQDQFGGTESSTRLELKAGTLSLSDDFDKLRYAGSTRTQFMNWSLWNNTAWDFAADTRRYTDGFVLAYVSPRRTLRYGAYRMPRFANGQVLESSLRRARGENLELTFAPWHSGTIVHMLAYRNIARMGDYVEALAPAAASGARPDIGADDRNGRLDYALEQILELYYRLQWPSVPMSPGAMGSRLPLRVHVEY